MSPLLARPFVTRNADVVAMLVPSLETALAETTTSRTIAEDVRAALSHRMTGDRPSVEKVARTMGMSSRTLQRRLGELGTSYQALLDDVRRDAAPEAAREHRSRRERDRVPTRLRGAQLVQSGVPRLGRRDADECGATSMPPGWPYTRSARRDEREHDMATRMRRP